MIQETTRLKVADNSGAREIMCIRVMGGSNRRYAAVGDIIIASVKVAAPNAAIKKGEVVRAVQEAAARGGRIMAFTDAGGAGALSRFAERVVTLPAVDPFVAPILHAIPVQLLAYHVAVLKGTDVDQPRNLAKSVTVE